MEAYIVNVSGARKMLSALRPVVIECDVQLMALLRFLIYLGLTPIETSFKFSLAFTISNATPTSSGEIADVPMNSTPYPRPVKILRSRNVGFFSNLHGVLGAAHHCENSGEDLVVRFDLGAYVQTDRGPNWWEYYFIPTCNADPFSLPLDPHWHKESTSYSYRGRGIERRRASTLIQKYCQIQSGIQDEIDTFISTHFNSAPFLAVQLRGTDKVDEGAINITPELLHESILAMDDAIGSRLPIYLATDEQRYVSMMRKYFGDSRLFYLNAIRSHSTTPVHDCKFPHPEAFRLGKEALMDCVILSRATHLFWTISNLSDCALKWNPTLRGNNLTQLQRKMNDARPAT